MCWTGSKRRATNTTASCPQLFASIPKLTKVLLVSDSLGHQGISLNQMANDLLNMQITQLEMIASLDSRLRRKSISSLKRSVRSILQKAPSREVPEWDRIGWRKFCAPCSPPSPPPLRIRMLYGGGAESGSLEQQGRGHRPASISLYGGGAVAERLNFVLDFSEMFLHNSLHANVIQIAEFNHEYSREDKCSRSAIASVISN